MIIYDNVQPTVSRRSEVSMNDRKKGHTDCVTKINTVWFPGSLALSKRAQKVYLFDLALFRGPFCSSDNSEGKIS